MNLDSFHGAKSLETYAYLSDKLNNRLAGGGKVVVPAQRPAKGTDESEMLICHCWISLSLIVGGRPHVDPGRHILGQVAQGLQDYAQTMEYVYSEGRHGRIINNSTGAFAMNLIQLALDRQPPEEFAQLASWVSLTDLLDNQATAIQVLSNLLTVVKRTANRETARLLEPLFKHMVSELGQSSIKAAG